MHPVAQYIHSISQCHQRGNATEHSYRGDLQQLIQTLLPKIAVTNEPKRQQCGSPDYILTKDDIPIGFIEAKDIGDKDLKGKRQSGNKAQFDRYKAGISNLIFTDYIQFHFYHDGKCYKEIAIAEVVDEKIIPIQQNFAPFSVLLDDFCDQVNQIIKNPKELAKMMAGKARLLADIIEKSLTSDEHNAEDSELKQQMNAFKDILIHDITPQGFADVYAQTITYGMFAARLHDAKLETFSRQEAAELIPKSNPFLRKLFSYIAGPDIDDRIQWVVDSLAKLFLACDVQQILNSYGRTTKTEQPIIHFYETFLAEYDPKLRKSRGVWYTPAPVVDFIVRAVDEILKTEFNLAEGLADTAKTTITVDRQGKPIKQQLHKVQILDPATGTGTFLAEIVKHIKQQFKGQQGIWSGYVQNHLLPRLNGFELLMASYAMAHLQLDLLLKATGYTATPKQRTQIYLTNSLEEHHPDTGTLFAQWLSNEANEANHIKRDTPVMCILGNPPYSGESANKGDWIMQLMEDYKKEPGGKIKLQERNPKWINDDYVKFLRYGQHFIEKNGSGVLAFINPHGFLDNPTFRGMRWNLLKTYDKIYTIDLHGNSKKKETTPDGSKDENVFDIMQGVSINIFIKTGKSKQLGKVYHYDLYGKRTDKYDFLLNNSIATVPYKLLPNKAPMYFMVQKDFALEAKYQQGFAVNECFPLNNVGIVTARDSFTIHNSKYDVENTIIEFLSLDDETARIRFNLGKDVRDWQVNFAKQDLKNHYPKNGVFTQIAYRPFDERFTFYTGKSRGFHCYPRNEIMRHFLAGDNVGLAGIRINKEKDEVGYTSVFITKNIAEARLADRFITNLFPLYLYPDEKQLDLVENDQRKPNLDPAILAKIAKKLGLPFVSEKQADQQATFAPIDILDYIYAVLHAPSYRERYKAFLKIDFPRLPYPKNKTTFWQLVELGSQIRQLHLLESPTVTKFITQYPISGNNQITRPIRQADYMISDKAKQTGRIWINDQQYFDQVPRIAWEFYIGGYQPAQKWLKDRREKTLQYEDIRHYQKIIVALSQTHTLMQKIATIQIE